MADPKSHGQMMNYLVRNSEDKKRMREYFETNQITTASNINRPEGAEVRQIFEDFNFRNPLADGGRIGFAEGEGPGGSRPRTDLLFENLTRKQNAIKNKVNQRNASGFANLPGHDNITYTDYKNKKTGEIVTKYNVRIRIQDKNVQKIGTTADKYKNIDTLEEAIKLRDEFRKLNPKNIKEKDIEKIKITKKERRDFIKAAGGVEDFETAKEGTGVQKGHAQNIENPNIKIKPSNIIYTPTTINEAMAGRGDEKALDLDFKIREAEEKMQKIKKSKMPAAKKKKELGKIDNLLMKYVAQSDGFKTVTLSDGNVYGEVFQKGRSMDMFDEFSNMTEKQTRDFVRKYLTVDGNLKPFYQRQVDQAAKLKKPLEEVMNPVDIENIKKSKIFLENVQLAKQNAERLVKEDMSQKLGELGCPTAKFALGGRVKFNQGSACVIKGREKLESILKKAGRASPQDQVLAQGILKAGQGLKNAFALRGLLGPAAIAFTTLTEGGIVGYDMLAQGKTLKEAMGDSVFNLMLGDDYKFNNDFMSAGGTFDERLDKLRFNSQQKQLINNFRSYVREADALGQAQIDVDKAQLRVKGSPVQDIIKDGPPSVLGKQFTRFIKPPTGKEKEAREADLAAAIAAKEAADQSFQTRVQNLDFAKRMQSGMTEGADLMSKAIDLARLQQLGSVDQNIFGKAFEGDIAKEARRDEILKLLPTALNFAGGGIAKQAGDPSGAMLKSMNPDSQGLSGLLKRAKKI